MSVGQWTAKMLAVTGRLVLTSWVAVPGWLVALAAMGGALDALFVDQRGNVFYSVLSIFAQFLLMSRLLLQTGRHHAWGKPGRAASFVGANIVTGLAILFGCVLLILPGLYLAARWLLVCPLIIGGGLTMGEALKESWRRTASHVGPLMVGLALLFAPGLGGLVLLIAPAYPEYGPVPPIPALAANLFLSGAVVLGWCLAVAAHIVLDPEDQTHSEAPGGNAAAA